jgi:hypothetical protein
MAISTCVVSGTLKDLTGAALVGYSVYAYLTTPFFHSDGTLIPPYKVSTTTDSSGNWSLTLIETTSISKTITIAFDLPTGTAERMRREYTVTIPNQASVNFDTLVTGQ